MLSKSLYLEIDKPNYVPIYTVQYDYNSRFYEIAILNNSQPLDLTGIRVIVAGKKPDGKEVFNSCKVLDAKKGLIQLELTEQMNAVNGASEYALELFSADGMLSSQPFKLIVTRSTISKSVESSKELGALKDALNEVQDIDNRFAQTNAQLSQKANANEVRGRYEPIMLEDLHSEVRTAMTGGSVAVVGENCIGTENLKRGAVTHNITGWYEVEGNLFIPENLVKGYYNTSGNLSQYQDFYTSDFIPVSKNEKLIQSDATYYSFWDVSRNPISFHNGNTNITVPDNDSIVYIRISVQQSKFNTHYLVKSGTVPTTVTKYYDANLLIKGNNIDNGAVDNDQLKDNSISREKMSYYQLFEKNNLYDRSNAMIGQTYNDNGKLVNGYNNTNFIETEPRTTYYYTDQKSGGWTCYWTRNKEFISGAITQARITTPENCYFVTVLIYDGYVDDFYFSKDKDNPTDVKYTDDKLYISGDKIFNVDKLLATPLNDSVSTEKIQDNAVTIKKVDFVDKLYSVNLFDKDDNVKNGYYRENGTWSNGGDLYSSTHIPVEPNTEYTFKATQGASWAKAYWDENKVALGVHNWSSKFVTPENCYYVTVTMAESDIETAMLVKGSTVPSEYVPFVTYELSERVLPISKIKEIIQSMAGVGSNLSGLKWNVLGDSITNGYGHTPYHTFIAKNKGMALVRNYGISGNKLATDSGGVGIPMCIRYAEMDDDADIITVMGGTNDQTYGVPLGVMSDRTVDTFYGSLHVLILGLIEKYPGKVIAFFTPIQRQGCKNTNGFSESGLVKYVDAIIDVCAYYSIPCLDLFRKGGLQLDVPSIKEEYMTDGTHPTSKGHEEVLARIIGGFLESIC